MKFMNFIGYEDLYDCLKLMVNWTYRHQRFHSSVLDSISRKAWLKEFSTIKFCLPRQSGHTSFAIRLMKELDDCILLVPNHKFAEIIFDKFNLGSKKRNVGTFYSFCYKMIGMKIKNVIVDCSSFVSSSEKEKLYNFLNDGCNIKDFGCIIFLE